MTPSNSGGQVRTEEAGIGSFVCKSPNRRKAEIDGGGGVVRLLEEDAIACHNRLVEREARLLAVPIDELPDRMII
jgi:hypothetical protein